MNLDKMEENLLNLIDSCNLTPNKDVRRDSPRLTSWVRYMSQKHYALIRDVLESKKVSTVTELINEVEYCVADETPKYIVTEDKMHALHLCGIYDVVFSDNCFKLYKNKDKRRKVKESKFTLPDLAKHMCCNKDMDIAIIYYCALISILSNHVQVDKHAEYICSYIRILLRRYAVYVDPFNHTDFMSRFQVRENLSVAPTRKGNYVELVTSKDMAVVRVNVTDDGIYFQIDDSWSCCYKLPILGMLSPVERANSAMHVLSVLLNHCSVQSAFGGFVVSDAHTPLLTFDFGSNKAHSLTEACEMLMLNDLEKLHTRDVRV